MFKYTTETVNIVNFNDLDDAITEFLKSKGFVFVYGGSYSAVAEEAWFNGEAHSITVIAKLPDHNQLEKFELNKMLSLQTILNWMCADGLIPESQYLIEVFW